MKNFMWSVTEIYAVGSLLTFFFVLSMWILLLCLRDLIAFECVLWPVRLSEKDTWRDTQLRWLWVSTRAADCRSYGNLRDAVISHFSPLLDEINKASSLWQCDCICTRALERVCVPEREKNCARVHFCRVEGAVTGRFILKKKSFCGIIKFGYCAADLFYFLHLLWLFFIHLFLWVSPWAYFQYRISILPWFNN